MTHGKHLQYGTLSQSLLSQAIKRKIFVSYHHGGDRPYYDAFSRAMHSEYELLQDRSLRLEIKSDDSDYVIRRLREDYIVGTSCTIVLVGLETHQRKFVDWEIKATLDKGHGLIGITLSAGLLGPILPDRLHDNLISGYAIQLSWRALDRNPSVIRSAIEQANSCPKYLIDNSRRRRLRNG